MTYLKNFTALQIPVFQKTSSKDVFVRCHHFFEKPKIFEDCKIHNLNHYVICLFLVVFLFALPVSAQGLLTAPQDNKPDNLPLIITADDELQWDRNERVFIASGNALARQGNVSLSGQTLRAEYIETAQNNTDIQRVKAFENVEIRSGANVVYGDEVDYDLTTDQAIVTGEALKFISPDHILTARTRFEYWPNRGYFQAIDNARLEARNDRGELNILEADKLTATFIENAQGKRILQKLNAFGNVKITTPTEILTADEGVYNAIAKTAQVQNNVKITRGPNILEGEKADIDLNTNISRMTGGAISQGSDGRVRGVFYPGSRE